MSTAIGIKQQEVRELETVRFVTSALFEVSAESIGRLRLAFEKNRLFYTEISDLYQSIKQVASLRGHLENKVSTKVRGVSVAFTSNTRFYGSVNSDVMQTFLEHMRVTKRDCIVIGKTGQTFMGNYPEFEKRCSFFSFEGDQPTNKEMRQFLKKVDVYDQVYVFHPSFVNVFSQSVAAFDITHTPRLVELSDSDESFQKVDYIFEPELPKILHFFETRVRYLLFQRAMLESELARTSARLLAMSRAEERADDALKRVRHSLKREQETFNDMRLLESFSAIVKWRH